MKYNIRMEYAVKTDIGNIRDKNEDYLYADGRLFIVADGMGGHQAGEVASMMAVGSFVECFKSKLEELRQEKLSRSELPGKQAIKNILSYCAVQSNKKIYLNSISDPGLMGMGTTFTGCYICRKNATIIHIGDSRLYIKRNNNLELLTDDHTIVGELYRSGKISYRQSVNHPQRNFLTRVMGMAEDIEPDIFSKKLVAGDTLLLCSDGLTSMLMDNQILKIMQKYGNDIKKMPEILIKNSLKRGGLDNITVIAIQI